MNFATTMLAAAVLSASASNPAETTSPAYGLTMLEQTEIGQTIDAATVKRKRNRVNTFKTRKARIKRNRVGVFKPNKVRIKRHRRQANDLTGNGVSFDTCNQSGGAAGSNCEIDTFEQNCTANDGVLETLPGGGINCNTDHWD